MSDSAREAPTGDGPRTTPRTAGRTWLALILISLAAFAGWSLLRNAGPIGIDIRDRTGVARLLADTRSPAIGPRDATVQMVVFTDYQCPACRASHGAMHRAVREAGDVRLVYRDLPIFGPVSERAARVALAARNQDLYPQIHDAFMRDTRRLEEPVLRELVVRHGGDWQRIERDLETDPAIGRQLATNQRDALRLGVAATPTYLVGPYLIEGALDADEFAAAFAQARALALD